MLEVQFGQSSTPGKLSRSNTDSMGAYIPATRQEARARGYLFAVADGGGGLDLGDAASATAVSVLTEEFGQTEPGAMLISLLPRLIETANAAVHERTGELRGTTLATTVVACALRHDQAVISHVGDSRCYLVRNGQARQITQDHTWISEQRRRGPISDDEVAVSEKRNALLRALGPEAEVAADTTALTLLPGDVLVLCTDGVHHEMNAATIAEIVSQHKTAAEMAHELVARAVELGGRDNTTAQVIRVRSVEQVGLYRSNPYRMNE